MAAAAALPASPFGTAEHDEYAQDVMLNCWARVGHSSDQSLELFAHGPTPCAGARLHETTRLEEEEEDAIKKSFEPGVLVWLHRARRDLVFVTVMGCL